MNKPTQEPPVHYPQDQNNPYSTATINPGYRPDIPPTPFHRVPSDKIPVQPPPDASNQPHRRPSLNVSKRPPHSVNPIHNNVQQMALSYGGTPPPLPDLHPMPTAPSANYNGSPSSFPQNMPSPHYTPAIPGPSSQLQSRPSRPAYQGIAPPLPSSVPFSSAPSYRPYGGVPPGSEAMSPSHGFIGAGVPSYSSNHPMAPPSSQQFHGAQPYASNFTPYGYGGAPSTAPNPIPGGYPGIPPPLPPHADFGVAPQHSSYPPRQSAGYLPSADPGFSYDSGIPGYGSQAPPPGYAPGPVGYSGHAPPPPGHSGFTDAPFDARPHQMQMQPPLQPQGSASFGYGGRPPPHLGGPAPSFGYSGTPPPLPSGYAHPQGYAGGPPYDGGYLRKPGYKGRPPALPNGLPAGPDQDPDSGPANAGGLSGLKQKFMQKVADPNVLGGVGKFFGR